MTTDEIQEPGYLGFKVFNRAGWERFATEVLRLGVPRRLGGALWHLEPAPGVRIKVPFRHTNPRHRLLTVAPRSRGSRPKKRIPRIMIEWGNVTEVGGGVLVGDAAWKVEDYGRASLCGHRPYGVMPGQGPAMPAPVMEVA